MHRRSRSTATSRLESHSWNQFVFMTTQRDPTSRRDDAPVRIVAHRLQQTGGGTSPAPESPRARPPNGKGAQTSARETFSDRSTRLPQVVLVDREVDALRDVAVA